MRGSQGFAAWQPGALAKADTIAAMHITTRLQAHPRNTPCPR